MVDFRLEVMAVGPAQRNCFFNYDKELIQRGVGTASCGFYGFKSLIVTKIWGILTKSMFVGSRRESVPFP